MRRGGRAVAARGGAVGGLGGHAGWFSRLPSSRALSMHSSRRCHSMSFLAPCPRHKPTEIALPDGCRVPHGALNKSSKGGQLLRSTSATPLPHQLEWFKREATLVSAVPKTACTPQNRASHRKGISSETFVNTGYWHIEKSVTKELNAVRTFRSSPHLPTTYLKPHWPQHARGRAVRVWTIRVLFKARRRTHCGNSHSPPTVARL